MLKFLLVLSIINKILDPNKRELNRLAPLVAKINSVEPEISKLSDAKLADKTKEFKERLGKGETLDQILPEAFAVVREASLRTTGMRHFDVQLMAGMVLHEGKIAEQKTGEGKTLSATLALYLNALIEQGAHLVTVNDYLARRDAEWMGPIYHLLGLSVGCLNHEKSYLYDPTLLRQGYGGQEGEADLPAEAEAEAGTPEEMALGQGRYLREVSRREAYGADITYGTNNEFGFDYLRDNMVYDLSQMVQINRRRATPPRRGVPPEAGEGAHHFAIVDEVDSLLIDEARTPLIISAPSEEPTQRYYEFAKLVGQLTAETDYKIDEKQKSASLTEVGIRKLEKMLGVENLYEKDFDAVKHVEQALKAKTLFLKDRDYVVKEGQIIIVDEFTGRLMFGRRYSEGLHQAIEAKEQVPIQKESKTLATISFQNYFRMYEKLAGMTGTAATEAEEFYKIYGLEVVSVPTHKPMVRVDYPDVVYKTVSAKFRSAAHEIEEHHRRGQPVLVGTTSIEKNELLSRLLKQKKIPHEILNAKQHEKEAQILAKAGQKGAVTVATNMAGRGVDIKLGEGVRELGGLHVLGTERHEARRIDNQLRGRSGRQGDPGSSRFYVSLQDDLMRIFGGQMVESLMDRFGMEEDIPLEHGLVSKAIENAQKKVEGHNFDIRKYLVEYDDVANKQREIIYGIRRKVLEALGARTPVEEFRDWYFEKITPYLPNFPEIWEQNYGKVKEAWVKFVGQLTLSTLDFFWIDHITTMNELREGIGLAGYGGKDPLVEYKRQGRDLFERLVSTIWAETAARLSKVKVEVRERASGPVERPDVLEQGSEASHPSPSVSGAQEKDVTGPIVRKKIGRNDPCWCGSGKKWKKCHYPTLPSG